MEDGKLSMFGIDPGTAQSAIVSFNGRKLSFAKILPNDALLLMLRRSKDSLSGNRVAIESIASYGMAVGRETFETCEWCGRFREAAEQNGATVLKVYRKDVKMFLCNNGKAKDANISQALRDKYGDVGTKKEPGMLYGISSHLWAALAVADYALSRP